MSTTPSPRSPGQTSPGSTRQLLDELDALMQRMLALPVNQLEDDAVAATSSVLPSAPAPAVEGTGAKAAVEAPDARKVVAHPPATIFPQLPHRAEATPPTPPERERFTPPDEPAILIPPVREVRAMLPPGPAAPPLMPGPLPRPSTRATPAPRQSPARPPSTAPGVPKPTAPLRSLRVSEWVLRSLLWSNRAFDRWTGWLGRPGRWLRGPRGRTVLGWVGLGLWATALLLIVWRILR